MCLELHARHAVKWKFGPSRRPFPVVRDPACERLPFPVLQTPAAAASPAPLARVGAGSQSVRLCPEQYSSASGRVSSEAARFLTGQDWSASDAGRRACVLPAGVCVRACVHQVGEGSMSSFSHCPAAGDVAMAWEGSWGCSFLFLMSVPSCRRVQTGPAFPSPLSSGGEKCLQCERLCRRLRWSQRAMCVYTGSCGGAHTPGKVAVSLYVRLLGLGSPNVLKAERRGKPLKDGLAVHLRMIWQLILSSHG